MEQRRLRSKNGTLDRTLFGNNKSTSKDYKNVVVVPRSELLTMQGEGILASTSKSNTSQRMDTTQSNPNTMTRKQRMQALDNRRTLVVDNDRKNQANQAVLSRARELLDEGLDEVKQINQMANYAKCATIRDRQILEKQAMREAAARENSRLDTLMEIERVQRSREEDLRNQFRREEQKQGANVILDQINERQQQRLAQQEQLRVDAQQMLMKIKADEEAERAAQLKKAEASKQLMYDIKSANITQSEAKLKQKEIELMEDAKILEYIRLKDARQQALEDEKYRAARLREIEVARLRSLQEKAIDRQSQIDELRAQRYQEEAERQWRDQQLVKARNAALLQQELLASRQDQRLERAKRMAEEALREREEYERINVHNKSQMDRELQYQAEALAKQRSYGDALKTQVIERQHHKNMNKQRFLEEGSNYTAQAAADKAKLLRIKELKIAELERAGVPAKYLTELSNAGK